MKYDFYTFNTLCILYNVNGEEYIKEYCITETKDGYFLNDPPRDEDFEELNDFNKRMIEENKNKIKYEVERIKTIDLFLEGKWLCVNSAKEKYLNFIKRLHISEDSLIKVYKDKGYNMRWGHDIYKINENDPKYYREITTNCNNVYVFNSKRRNSYDSEHSMNYIIYDSDIDDSSTILSCDSEDDKYIILEKQRQERREAERKIEEERKKIEEERKKKEREEREKEEIRRSKEYEERRRKTQYMPTIDEAMCYNCQLENGIIDSSDVLHRCPKHIARFGIYRPVYNNDE